ncbi:MAG: efflux RND transporter permease subunit, partial [Chlamydiia bacterium]|nr:efflux RND transporter permease subunit [Chlamydiia bacterium]
MPLIRWAIHNPVPINLVMVLLLLLGFGAGSKIERELFPKFELDQVSITVDMEGGSTPDQIDRNIAQIILPRIQNLDGVKQVQSISTESRATILVDVESGADSHQVKEEVKAEIDTIRTFPEQALDPQIQVLKHFERAINVAVFGEHVEPKELRKIAELIKNEMKALGVVSRAEIVSAPP